jgi:sigma-B regulation protein RsbU (phosphoserine phosphatase)
MSMTGAMVWADDDRLRRIEAVTDAALARLDVEDLLVELLDRVRELLGVDTAAVLLLDSASQQLVATAARGIEEEVRQGVRIPLGKGFAGRIAAEKKPVIVDAVDHSTVLNPILRERGIRSLLGAPLVSGGKVIGVLHVGSLTSRQFTANDVSLLQLVADRVALAVQARLSQVERTAAGVLQRSLLPPRLPDVPGLELAARYVPGEEGQVGGDWYDVFALPSGRLWLVMGDVAGRGLAAAVVMGRLRAALRAYTLDDSAAAGVLGRMDTNVQQFEPEVMATVLCATLEPSFDRLHLSSAGHPAPVLAVPGQPAVMLDVPIDPPLGVRGPLQRRTSTIDVPPDALLLLYTDGLVERRTASLESNLERLRASMIAGPAESVVMALFAKLVGSEALGDDIAMLAVRRIGSAIVPASRRPDTVG